MKKESSILNNEYGICDLSMIPVHRGPGLEEPLVTQLLFGQTFQVIKNRKKIWVYVESMVDQCRGWIHAEHGLGLTSKKLKKYQDRYAISLEMVQPAFSEHAAIYLPFGSHLPKYDGLTFQMPSGSFSYSGQAISTAPEVIDTDWFERLCRKFLHSGASPGGKTCFGIDAGGFIQLIYSALGIDISRDLQMQVAEGEMVHFYAEARCTDLAFFEDKEGHLCHAGILLEDNKVIHVDGRVRIDNIDHQGIFRRDRRSYTHVLKIIRRLVPTIQIPTSP